MFETMKEYLCDLEHLPYGIAIVQSDPFATITQANPAFYRIIGHTKEQFLSNHNNQLMSILLDDVYCLIKDVIATGKDYDIEWDLRLTAHDGSVRWVHDMVHYDASKDLFFITLTDITDKLVATTHDLSYDSFQARNIILGYMNTYSAEYIAITDDVTDEVVYLNPSAEMLLGFTCESDWKGKPYADIGFGGKEHIDPSYYAPVTEDEFTVRQYYNAFHDMYFIGKSKLIYVPPLRRTLRLNLISDITAQTKLSHRLALQKTLHDCMDALFITGSTQKDPETAYYQVLKELKEYYEADGAFFYKFKEGTHVVENLYKVFSNGVLAANPQMPMTLSDEQVRMMRAFSGTTTGDNARVMGTLSKEYQEIIHKYHTEYGINDFACVAVDNEDGDMLAFLGITNARVNENAIELLELLSRFVCLFIEHEHHDNAREQALQLEIISKTKVWDICRDNYQHMTNVGENISDTLNAICHHYDADFAVVMMPQDDGSCVVNYFGGADIPDTQFLNTQSPKIMERWLEIFKKHPQYASDGDFVDLKSSALKRLLRTKCGIANFVASPMRDTKGEIIGVLFVNNIKMLGRSSLLVHVVAKSTSDYLAKISMRRKARIEPATQLTNKISTQNRIARLLDDGSCGTLFLGDIDAFKNLNDTLGHQVGDQAIVDTADILKKIFRSTDVIGRVGGDEFMVFTPGLTSAQDVATKAEQIVRQCDRNYDKDGLCAHITASVGIAIVSESGITFDRLYEKVDAALYTAKKNGKNQYYIDG